MRHSPTFLAFLLFGVLAEMAAAQTPTNSPAPSPAPATGAALKTTTRLVQLNVIVENGRGQPVVNLRKEDFSLTDEGTAQEIAIFSPAVSLLQHPVAPSGPAHVFDNREIESGKSGAVSVILFDALNTPFEDQVYAKEQMLKLLSRRQPKEYLAVYYLRDELYVLQDFTTDSQALIRAMDRLKPNALAPLDASTPRLADPMGRSGDAGFSQLDQQRTDRANPEMFSEAIKERILRTTGAFTAIAEHLAYISGRKSLIWVSGSFPIIAGYGGTALVPASLDAGSFSTELDRAARALNRVNMSVYPVDTAGVVPASAGFFGRMGARDSMNELARETGGHAFYGTNDIAGSVDKAIEETESAYLLGFYPNHNLWDGSFRHIQLRLKAKGLHLRYREGYYAAADAPDQKGEMEMDLTRAAKNPVDSTSLHLRVTFKVLEAPPSRTLRLYLRVDPKELFLTEGNDGVRSGGLDLLFFQLGGGEQRSWPSTGTSS